MCGHVGIAGKLEHKDEATLKRLLVLDYFRGPDSTGLAVVPKKDGDPILIAKAATHPFDLFQMKSFDKALTGYTSKVFLGHNRAATKGKVNGANAHPYEYGHIVGAHNGTLSAESWSDLNKILGYDTDVDSQAIFACIEKVGIEETVKVLQGAWALIWYDSTEDTLNFLRNDQRTLWYSFSQEHDKIFWASEWPMIHAATKLSGATYELSKDKEGAGFFPFHDDALYTIHLSELIEGSQDRPRFKAKTLKGKPPKPVATSVNYYGGNHDPFRRGGTNTTVLGKPTSTTTKLIGGIKQQAFGTVNVVDLVGTVEEPLGPYITVDRFEDVAKFGCSFCDAAIDMDDIGIAFYDSRDIVLCGECTGHGDHSRVYVEGSLDDCLNKECA